MKRSEMKPAIEKEYDLDNRDDKNAYDEMLNECSDEIKIGCLTFEPSRVVEELDPTAYRCGFNDWADSEPRRWECPECGEIHEEEEDALLCCQTEDEETETE